MPEASFLDAVLTAADESRSGRFPAHRAPGLAGSRYVLAVALLVALVAAPMAVAVGAGSAALDRSAPAVDAVAVSPFISAGGDPVVVASDRSAAADRSEPVSRYAPCAAKVGPLADACLFR